MTTFGQSPFPSTVWATVLQAAHSDGERYRASLEDLIRVYWGPVYSYVKALVRQTRDDAEDITQSFFTRLLERHDLERLDPALGSFRGYLKRAVRNYVIDVMRRDDAHGPVFRVEEFDAAASEAPDRVFEAEWDRTVCEAALAELEGRMQRAGASHCYEVFRAYCLEESPDHRRTYREVAERLGLTESLVRQHLERCRAQLRDILWTKIREYASDETDVRAEFRRLMAS